MIPGGRESTEITIECRACRAGLPIIWHVQSKKYMHLAQGLSVTACRVLDAGGQLRPAALQTWQRDVILRNVEKDPSYAPYCMRCQGLVRMRTIERHYWRCRCGAQCDYR